MIDKEYNEWKNKPNPDSFNKLITKANPIINSSLQLYVGNTSDPAARSKAKVLTSKAIKSYDPNKGAKLKTHIMTQLQPLRRFAAKRRTLTHIPEEAQRNQAELNDAKVQLEDTLDREPSDAELADFTGYSLKRIQNLRKRVSPTAEGSLGEDVPMPGVSSKSQGDMWADAVYYDLSDIDRKIMEWRIGYGGHNTLSNNEIAKKLGISAPAVSQRVAAISRKLEEGLNAY